MHFIKLLSLTAVLACLPLHSISAEETASEKAAEVVEDAQKNAKKMGRAAADKACPIVNGKVDCTMKKMKHKAQNAADEMKDKADDATKKAN